VRDYIRIAGAAGINYARLCGLPDAEVQACFGKKKAGRRVLHGELDYKAMQRELLRKGVTLQILWEEYLREQPAGYSYSQYCHLYRRWCKGRTVVMRRDYKGGEKGFVDYAGLTVEIVNRESGEITLAHIFVMVLGASNYTFAEATPSQELHHWIGSHIRAFQYFGGVPEIVVPDNLTSGVTSPCRYEPGVNRTYQELAEHYGVAVIPARVKSPRDKAKVEEAVQNVERRILARLRNETFYTVAELNQAIKPLLFELNEREMQVYGVSRRELFEKVDKAALKPLPARPFELSSWKQARVNIDYHIEVKRHYYSVPYRLVHEVVDVRMTEGVIEIFHQGRQVALHPRSNVPGKYTTLKEHMPEAHQYMQDWSPTRLKSWAEKIGPQTLYQVELKLGSRLHPEQAYRACLGLLSLSKKYGNGRLEAACKKLNSFGPVPLSAIKAVLVRGTDRISEANDSKPIRHSNIRPTTDFH
jgi:transposase